MNYKRCKVYHDGSHYSRLSIALEYRIKKRTEPRATLSPMACIFSSVMMRSSLRSNWNLLDFIFYTSDILFAFRQGTEGAQVEKRQVSIPIQMAAVNGIGKILLANRKEPDLTFVKSSSIGTYEVFGRNFPVYSCADLCHTSPRKGDKISEHPLYYKSTGKEERHGKKKENR